MKWRKLVEAPYLFVFLALVFGVIFVRILPPLWGLDEITHFNRAYQISTGNFFEDKLSKGSYGGNTPSNIVGLSGYTYLDLVDSQKVDSQKKIDYFASQRISKNTQKYDFTGGAVYPPFVYTAPASAIWLSRELNAPIRYVIYSARFAVLLLYIAIVSLALKIVKDKKAKWLIFVIGLFPMAVIQAATVSADSVVISLGLLLFALLSSLWDTHPSLSRRKYALIIGVSLLIAFIKPVYLPLSLLAVCIPATLVPYKSKLTARTVSALVITLPIALWAIYIRQAAAVGAAGQLGSTAAHRVNPKSQLLFVIEHIPRFGHFLIHNTVIQDWYGQTFGLLGWNYVQTPSPVRYLLLMSLIVVSLWYYPKIKNGKPASWLFILAAATTMVGFVLFFYLIYNGVGSPLISGVQGRYFIPALPFLFYGLGRIIKPIRIHMTEATVTILVCSISLISLLASVLLYYSATYQ